MQNDNEQRLDFTTARLESRILTQPHIWVQEQALKIKSSTSNKAQHPPLFLQQGLCVLLVFPSPGVQLSLHGVHVFLDVVHDLAQRQGAAAHGLDGRAQPLNLPHHHVLLFLSRCFRDHVLEVKVVWRVSCKEQKQWCRPLTKDLNKPNVIQGAELFIRFMCVV